MSMDILEIKPQEGKQTDFITSPADIAIYGGAAMGGKTFSILIEPLRHIENPLFRGVIFRRTYADITKPGALWDEANKIYPLFGGIPVRKEFHFPSGAIIQFSHMQHEKDCYSWQGAQLPFFGFDQIEGFTKKQFEYVALSRARTDSGIRPYVRATCNPDPDSFVADYVSWWIDQDTGYPIEERSGVLRYFVRSDDVIYWGDSPDELKEQFPTISPKSFTFISAKISDNKIGLNNNPDYMSSLQALSLVERERLLGGNWLIRESGGNIFRRGYFEIVDTPPSNPDVRIRYWDRAATKPNSKNPNPDYTVGLLLSLKDGVFYVEHIERFRDTPRVVEKAITTLAAQDGEETYVGLEQDVGQAGKQEIDYYMTKLSGFIIRVNRVTTSKIIRARPASSQAEAGNIKLVKGAWNEAFLVELENFPDANHDDQVDSLSGAFSILSPYNREVRIT